MSIYHKHHIVPRHMGGTDDPSNIVELTVEEHAEAHRKLFEEHGLWQDEIAWKALSGQITNAEAIKLAQSIANKGRKRIFSEEHKMNMRNGHKNRPPISEETRKKLSEAAKNRPAITEETRKKISESGKGRIFSQEARKKLSNAKVGSNHPLFGKSPSPETRKKISLALSGKKKRKTLLLGQSNI
jgi:hypothetical protein